MANEVFKPIEEFVLTSPTGSEQVQVSATQKVTLSQIAQLVKSAPLLSSEVTVTNFETHSYTGRYSFSAIPDNAAFSFKAAASATNGPGVAVYGLAIKISSDTAIYFAGDSSGAQYCIYGVAGSGTNVTNSLYGEGLTKVDVTDFKALTTLLSSIPSGTVVAYRAANTVANGPVSGAGSWGFIFKIDNSTYRVIANIFGGTAAGWGYDMYVGSISGTTTAYWSKINGASEIPDNVKYLSQAYVSDDLSTLWSELESMTNSGSVSAGDFFPFRFNADAAHAPTANAGHGFYQYGTNCAYAIIFEEVATGNGRAWFGHFESSDGEAVWTQIGAASDVTKIGQSQTVTNYTSNTFLSDGFSALNIGDIFGFSSTSATGGPSSSALFGIGQKLSALSCRYICSSAALKKTWIGVSDNSSAITWSEIGSGTPEAVIVPNGDWVNDTDFGFKKVGDMVPVIFEQGASGTPNSENAFSGYAICTTFTSSPLYWVADFVVSSPTYTEGTMFFGQVEYQNTPAWTRIGGTGASSGGEGPLSGYKALSSMVSVQIGTSVEKIVNFPKAVTNSDILSNYVYIDASIWDTAGVSMYSVVPPSPVKISSLSQGYPVMDFMTRSIASGTNVAQVKLIITSFISDMSMNVTGFNYIIQANNVDGSTARTLRFTPYLKEK